MDASKSVRSGTGRVIVSGARGRDHGEHEQADDAVRRAPRGVSARSEYAGVKATRAYSGEQWTSVTVPGAPKPPSLVSKKSSSGSQVRPSPRSSSPVTSQAISRGSRASPGVRRKKKIST